MATMLIYPNQDVSLGHSTSGNNGYSVLRDTDDSSYIYQSVTTNDFVTLDSVFNFDSITLSNMVINSVNAIVRMQTTGSEGVNMAYMQVIGSNSNPKYVTDPTYNNFTNCSFSLTINDIGASSNTIVTSETHSNIQLTLETRVKKTTSSKPNFEIQISEFYIVIDYTSTETNNNNEEEDVITHELSKIKLNGIIYNIKDSISRNAVAPPPATETTDGLLSADDKRLLNSLNPNIAKTISNLNASEFGIINAKNENALSLVMAVEPTISQQIRTINLLDVNSYTPGFYIGSNGQLASNTNDHVGDFIPVSPGDDIYYTGIIGPTNSSSINRRLHVYTANQTWIKQISFAGSLKVGNSWSTHGVVPANGAYVRISWGVEDTNVMITVGEPDKYYPYYMTPFTATSSVNFKVGHTNDPEDATTYTFNVPAAAGSLYGLEFDPIKGKLWKVTEHIASYNGETLPGHWQSDRDTYLEGTTPQIGAEVVYRLADEDIVEYDCTPMVIPLNYHENYFFIENGMFLELSYYAATFAVDHLTLYSGATLGDTNILETDVIAWNKAASLIDTKADLVGAQLTGNVTAPTVGITANSDRIATTAFVQQMLHTLAPFEPTVKASKNYEVGEYLTYAGNLYKVTAAIAKNANLTVGTNIEATDVVTELNLLRSLIQS